MTKSSLINSENVVIQVFIELVLVFAAGYVGQDSLTKDVLDLSEVC